MNRKLLLMLAVVLSLAILTGCKPKAARPPKVSTPDDQKATVTGRVISTSNNKPYPKAPVWLAEVYRSGGDGAYVLDHAFSPAAFADDQGYFVIANVDPKEYVIVVGDPDGVYVVIPDDAGRARVWQAEKGKILDVGVLNVSLVVPTAEPIHPTSTPVSGYPSPVKKNTYP